MTRSAGIDGSYRLSSAQVEAFEQRGFIVLRNVFSPDEVADLRPVILDYVMGVRDKMSANERAVGGSATRTLFDFREAPERVRGILVSPRLGEIAARLLQVEAVRFFNFYGFFKPGGGSPTPWHQDQTYIPLDTDSFLTMWIPMVDISQEMGGLVYAEGSHRAGPSSEPERECRNYRLVPDGPMQAGDVSVHLGWTIHFAMGNSTDRMREAFALSMFADQARLRVDRLLPYTQCLLDSCFAGLESGDLAAGPMTPLVYRQPKPQSHLSHSLMEEQAP